MRIKIFALASSALCHRGEELLGDRTLPASVRKMIYFHLTKPWAQNFGVVAIRPMGQGSSEYLDFPITEAFGSPWYFPSKRWWIAHARSSHPPLGKGCDVDVHTDFLSAEGATHEFDYANISTDGRMKILGRYDFMEECGWWPELMAD